MDLVEALSNTLTTSNLQRLTSADQHQVRRRRGRASYGVAPDGRRRFGSVGAAVVEVLSHAESELRVREIKTEVERLLGGPVARGSVKSYLANRCRGKAPLFERTARGRYRLLPKGN